MNEQELREKIAECLEEDWDDSGEDVFRTKADQLIPIITQYAGEEYYISTEDINRLGLEADRWYSLTFDGTTLKAYDSAGKFVKEITQREQEAVLMIKGTEHLEERLPLYEQRLDRPDREKIALEKIVQFLTIAQEVGNKGSYLDVWGNAKTLLSNLNALIPDEKEIRKQVLREVERCFSSKSAPHTFNDQSVEDCYFLKVKDWQALQGS